MNNFKEEVVIAEKEHAAGLHEKGKHYVYKNTCHECYKDYQEYLKGADRHTLRLAE